MDHRKLLVIILSVAVFVALVLGIALLAYYPGEQPGERVRDERGEFDPIEYVRSGEEPEIEREDEEDDDVVIIYGTRDEEPVEPEEERDPSDPPPEPDDDFVLEPLPDPDPREPAVRGRARDRADPDPEPTEAEPEPAPEPEPRPSVTAEPAPEARPDVPTREYWIQVVSSSSRDTAEAAKQRLASRDFGSVIFPVTVSGQNYYRVRVGPYDDRQEAQKFLSWIRDLEGFEESYVSRVTRS